MKRAQIVAALVEGNIINDTVRITCAAKHPVLKLLADLGKACAVYQDQAFRNLPCKHIQFNTYGLKNLLDHLPP